MRAALDIVVHRPRPPRGLAEYRMVLGPHGRGAYSRTDGSLAAPVKLEVLFATPWLLEELPERKSPIEVLKIAI